jgi:formylglycine-generating enzyme required for sulfatase activity
VRVVLSTACFGAPASFLGPPRTCIDGARRDASPAEGVLEDIGPSLVGTAIEAQERPCSSPSPAGAVCVKGGASVLGDPQLDGLQGVPTIPQRPVLVSPFHMDVTEFTVGRYRKLLARGALTNEPNRRNPSDELAQFCTWLGGDDASHDGYPLNCVSYPLAIRACNAEGGRLPTEAEWEHAARGRGRGYVFPWGDAPAQCCTASLSRPSLPGVPVECGSDSGAEPVGSHAKASCSPIDVSIDGIQDLAGSLTEVTTSGAVSYADPCWSGPGLRLDPRCGGEERMNAIARGGNWTEGKFLGAATLRRNVVMPSIGWGFRCVYPDAR